jgi:hypothetical protein
MDLPHGPEIVKFVAWLNIPLFELKCGIAGQEFTLRCAIRDRLEAPSHKMASVLAIILKLRCDA